MAAYGFAKSIKIVVCPCGRLVLLLRIGPPVTVVEIYHKSHSQFLGSPGLDQHVFLSAPAFLRINPHSQPYGIQPKFFHQGCTLHFNTVSGLESYSVPFHLGSPAYIRSFGECRRSIRLSRCLRAFVVAGCSQNGSGSCQYAVIGKSFHVCPLFLNEHSKLRTIIEKSYRRVTQKGTFCVILSRI